MDDGLSREVEWCVCQGEEREGEARFCSQAENWRRLEKREQTGQTGTGRTHQAHSPLSQAATLPCTHHRPQVTTQSHSPESLTLRRGLL